MAEKIIKARMMRGPEGRTDGGGVAHDMWIAWVDDEEDKNLVHWPCIIPLEQFTALLQPMTSAARVALYKTLILTYYNAQVVPLEAPTPPYSLSDLSLWDAYIDANEAYITELAQRTQDASTLAAQATAWIEGLATFTGWPFDFTLQNA